MMKIESLKEMSTRQAFTKAMEVLGERNERIYAVAADSMSRFGKLPKIAPRRTINVGIAEQNAMGIAAGIALCGGIVFITTYATFLSMRACEQVRTDIAFARLPVRIMGTDAGLSSGWVGFTHQALEDIGIMRSIPHMTVIVPADGEQTYQLMSHLIEYPGPVYVRLRGRGDDPHVEGKGSFKIGVGQQIREGYDITLIACGRMVKEAVEAHQTLSTMGVSARVLNIPTIKPIDEDLIVQAAVETQAILTIEEHNRIGGLGSAVAEVVSSTNPVQVKRMGLHDTFGIPGAPEDLLEHFGLTSNHIVGEVERLLHLKEGSCE